MRRIPFAGVELTSQRVRGLRGTSELPGRPERIEAVDLAAENEEYVVEVNWVGLDDEETT